MHWLQDLSSNVLSIYKESENSFSSYQKSTGLNCIEGCGKCCLGQEINASVLEMLPTALNSIKNGNAQNLLDRLESTEAPQCIFYIRTSDDGSKGHCSNYEFRPSVCRSFGVAAYRNKYGEKTATICKEIKGHYSQDMLNINLIDAPVVGEFARRINSQDTNLGTTLLPINTALRKAIEKVLFLSQYGD